MMAIMALLVNAVKCCWVQHAVDGKQQAGQMTGIMLLLRSGGSVDGRRPIACTAATNAGCARRGPGVERRPSGGDGAVPACGCCISSLACRSPCHWSAGACWNCSARAATAAAAAATCSHSIGRQRRHGCCLLCSVTYATSSCCSCAAATAGRQRRQLISVQTSEDSKAGRMAACAQGKCTQSETRIIPAFSRRAVQITHSAFVFSR